MTTPYSIDNAMLALPHLVNCAMQGDLLTYSELGALIDQHYRACDPLLAHIRDEICIKNGLPMISVLVVNKNSKKPGKSFLPEGTGNLSKQESEQRFERERQRVYAYPNWLQVLRRFNLQPVTRNRTR
jgi:hypothetical protein